MCHDVSVCVYGANGKHDKVVRRKRDAFHCAGFCEFVVDKLLAIACVWVLRLVFSALSGAPSLHVASRSARLSRSAPPPHRFAASGSGTGGCGWGPQQLSNSSSVKLYTLNWLAGTCILVYKQWIIKLWCARLLWSSLVQFHSFKKEPSSGISKGIWVAGHPDQRASGCFDYVQQLTLVGTTAWEPIMVAT